MDFLSLLTDPKVWIIFAIIALLVVLGIYTWRQSNHIEELKHQHTKMTEQVKHGLMLSEDGLHTKALVHLRPDMASTMSEETYDGGLQEPEDEEWDGAKSEDEDGDGELSDDEHNAYIQQLIRIQDGKRAKLDEFINPVQQQSGHGGTVYDSNDEEIIFHDYNEESDYASDTEIMKHVEKELSKSPPLLISATPSVQDKILQDMHRMDKELHSLSEIKPCETLTGTVATVPDSDSVDKEVKVKVKAEVKAKAKAEVKASKAEAEAEVKVDDVKEHTPLKLKLKLKEKPSKLKVKINPKVKS
jgi:hypothetical protein